MNNWDNLRVLLAVARGGSVTAGAKELGIDQSTVSRRLQSLESVLGRQLFHESKKRDQLTSFGEACVKSAIKLEAETQSLEKALLIDDFGYEGTVNISTGDILSDHLLLSLCADFLKAYPKINLRVTRQFDSETRFNSDIAILTTNSPKDDYFGRRLATATFASYASHDFLNEFQHKPEQMRWLNWDDGSGSPKWPALSPHIPDDMCRMRCTSVESLLEGARKGLGATILPCFIGEKDPALERITPGVVLSRREVWVFVQSDLRKVPKIRTFLDYLYERIIDAKSMIESD